MSAEIHVVFLDDEERTYKCGPDASYHSWRPTPTGLVIRPNTPEWGDRLVIPWTNVRLYDVVVNVEKRTDSLRVPAHSSESMVSEREEDCY